MRICTIFFIEFEVCHCLLFAVFMQTRISLVHLLLLYDFIERDTLFIMQFFWALFDYCYEMKDSGLSYEMP